MAVERIHLCLIGIEHPHFPRDGDEVPVSLVSVGEDLHPRLPSVFLHTRPTDFRQPVGHTDFPAGIEGLHQRDASQIHPVHLEFHFHHIEVGKHIGTHRHRVELREISGESDALVEFGLPDGVVGPLQVFVVPERHLPASRQRKRERFLGMYHRQAKGGGTKEE